MKSRQIKKEQKKASCACGNGLVLGIFEIDPPLTGKEEKLGKVKKAKSYARAINDRQMYGKKYKMSGKNY